MTVFDPYSLHPYRPNHLGFGGVNRDDDARSAAELLPSLMSQNSTKILPVWKSLNLFSQPLNADAPPQMAWLSGDDLTRLSPVVTETIYLGQQADKTSIVAVRLADDAHKDPAEMFAEAGYFGDLREASPLIDGAEGSILAYARALCFWHQRHQFCGVCGSPAVSTHSGHQRLCTSQTCSSPHFPRTDPAVIMLVTDGDKVLLGRQPQWPEGMLSALAGFVEPGETIEHAVAREVYEEVGINVRDVRYQHSQPWPFPASLMLGFTAEAETTTLTVNTDEIEQAGWYSRQDIARFNDKGLYLPRKLSIARRLIDDWLTSED